MSHTQGSCKKNNIEKQTFKTFSVLIFLLERTPRAVGIGLLAQTRDFLQHITINDAIRDNRLTQLAWLYASCTVLQT